MDNSLEAYSAPKLNQEEIDDKCDEQYGNLLSKYISDKNISKIQLEKKEYNHEFK